MWGNETGRNSMTAGKTAVELLGLLNKTFAEYQGCAEVIALFVKIVEPAPRPLPRDQQWRGLCRSEKRNRLKFDVRLS